MIFIHPFNKNSGDNLVSQREKKIRTSCNMREKIIKNYHKMA